jgi:phage shock protein C
MSTDVKRLYRSRKERMLGGLCGGLGAYFHIDPTLVRLVVILLSFFFPFMLLIYLVLWIFVPVEPEAAKPAEEVIDAEVK